VERALGWYRGQTSLLFARVGGGASLPTLKLRGASGRRRSGAVRGLIAICLFVLLVGFWNVAHYPPGKGYDAVDHIDYALGLVPGGQLPHGTGEYYTPPGYYALAGSAVWVAEQLGLDLATSERAAMALNVLMLLGIVLLVFQLASRLWPGRERMALAACAFVAFLPVVVESEAMFHPEMFSLLLSTLSIWLCVRLFDNPRYAVPVGVALGAAQLVRASALWAVGCVALALLVGRRYRSLVIVVALAAAIPAPWYIHQELTYSGEPAFAGIKTETKPIYDRQPLSFYVDPGIPDVITAPYQPHFDDLALPMTYTGIWGDYFGVWAWVARPNGPFKTTRIFPPPKSARRRLQIQSLVGLLPTLLALVGWLVLFRASLGRPARLVVALLPALGALSYLYFTVGYPTIDGGTLKTSYMLTTTPGWALGFGLAVDRLRGRIWVAAVVLLALCALADLTFIVYD
jgi:hypothetical protein